MSRKARQAGPAKPLDAVLAAAAGHINGGRLRAAIREIEKNGSALNHPTGQNIVGNAHLGAGRAGAALEAFDAAIRLSPQFPEAHCNRGVALQDLGRLDEALGALDEAIALRGAYPIAHFNRGNVLKALGRTDKAVIAYDRATTLEPRFAEAHLNRGFALLDLGRTETALKAFDLALRLKPAWGEALLGRAIALDRLNHAALALDAIDAMLAGDPDNGEALAIRGNALTGLKRTDEARTAYTSALKQLAETPAGLVTRANVLIGLDRHDEALAAADSSLGAEETADGHFVRASALRGLDRFAEQLEALDTALRLGKPGGAIHRARAIALGELGRLDEAAEAFEAALALDPTDARTRFDYAHLLLHRGDFERGLEEHEQRLRLPNFAYGIAGDAIPRWQGEEIAGRRLLVHAEQGLGDAIQMVRYLDRLVATKAAIGLAVPPPLQRLMASDVDQIEVIDLDADTRGFDYQVSLMSLPHVFGTTRDTIPAPIPYLKAEEPLAEAWRARIGTDGIKIGICWSGNPDYRADRFRSIPLAAFAPLATVAGVRLISLQAIHGLDQLEDLPPGMAVEDPGGTISNNPDGLAEIAGAMNAVDLVISADTAVAHLAGALGRPVWTAIRFQPEWRWLEGQSESPWYPTMWLFRQPALGDWDSIFIDMEGYLKKLSEDEDADVDSGHVI